MASTNAYGALPEAISNAASDSGLDIEIQHIHLDRYISFHDEVVMDDLARAMDAALRARPT